MCVYIGMCKGQRAKKQRAGRFGARQAKGEQGDESSSSAGSCSCRGAHEQRATRLLLLHLRKP